ncbi:MAG: hypothetical protein AB1846_09745 [Chloroflexota bacterium]
MKLRGVITTSLAISAGLIVLLGALVPMDLLAALRTELLQWAVLVAGFAVLVGIVNLLVVHLAKIRNKKGSGYSLLLVVSLLASLVVAIFSTPQGTGSRLLFDGIIQPVEASLMALMSISLLYASMRLLRHRAGLLSIVFIATAVILLLGAAPLPFGEIDILHYVIAPFIEQVPVAAGARGILIGVALGALTTGLRILFGADRPYGGK